MIVNMLTTLSDNIWLYPLISNMVCAIGKIWFAVYKCSV